MKIFRIKNRVVWHIPDSDGTSYCSSASINEDWYMKKRAADTVDVKERDGETLCSACVGMAYKAGAIEVTDKDVAE